MFMQLLGRCLSTVSTEVAGGCQRQGVVREALRENRWVRRETVPQTKGLSRLKAVRTRCERILQEKDKAIDTVIDSEVSSAKTTRSTRKPRDSTVGEKANPRINVILDETFCRQLQPLKNVPRKMKMIQTNSEIKNTTLKGLKELQKKKHLDRVWGCPGCLRV